MIVEKLTVERAKKFLEDNDYRVYKRSRIKVLHTHSILADIELESLEESLDIEQYMRRAMVQDLAHTILETPGLVWEVTNLHDTYVARKKIDLSIAFIQPKDD